MRRWIGLDMERAPECNAYGCIVRNSHIAILA
jgi:hypothetical protein